MVFLSCGCVKTKKKRAKISKNYWKKKKKALDVRQRFPKGARKSKRGNAIVFTSSQSNELTKNTLIEFERRLVERFASTLVHLTL